MAYTSPAHCALRLTHCGALWRMQQLGKGSRGDLVHEANYELGEVFRSCKTPDNRTMHGFSHTHVENRETRTKQEKRLKENSSGTAELSETSFGLLVENEQ